MKRTFLGVWIPREIWLDTNLSLQERCLYAEITSLSGLERGCVASNQYFAEFLGLSKERARKVVGALAKKGYVESVARYNERGEVVERLLRIKSRPVVGTDRTPLGESALEVWAEPTTILIQDINTDNNKYSPVLEKQDVVETSVEKIPYREIVDFMNEKLGTRYKPTSHKTQSCIKARWNEGFRLEDFKRVIENMRIRWRGTKWEQYLRPETLFGNKFEGYLNIKGEVKANRNALCEVERGNPSEYDLEF